MHLKQTRRKSNAAGVNLVDGDGRQLRCDRPHLSHRAEVARVAHQTQARDMSQRMGHALQAGFESLASERTPQFLVDGDPVPRGVQGLLGKMNRSCTDVLVRVASDLLEHAVGALPLCPAGDPAYAV